MPLTYEIWYDPNDPTDRADACGEGSSLSLTLTGDAEAQSGGNDVSYIRITYSKNSTGQFPTGPFTIYANPSDHSLEEIEPTVIDGPLTSEGRCTYEDNNGTYEIVFEPPTYASTEDSGATRWDFGLDQPPPKLKVIVKRQDDTYECPS